MPKLIPSWGERADYPMNPGTQNFDLSVDIVYKSSGHCYWEKDDVILEEFEEVNCEINGRRRMRLKFPPLQYGHSGLYKLTFKTSLADESWSESVRLVVEGMMQ